MLTLPPPLSALLSLSGTVIWVKLKGGINNKVEVRTENAVQVSSTLALSFNDFYDNQASFISSISSLLNITRAQIHIANIVPGKKLMSRRGLLASSTSLSYLLYDAPSVSGEITPHTEEQISLHEAHH